MRMIAEINSIASSLTTEAWYSNAGPLWSPAIFLQFLLLSKSTFTLIIVKYEAEADVR